MESEYDNKLTEMKKYIPFLENMISKLEKVGPGDENPRKAQLGKIRALRDLLQDNTKKMKMDNLNKCEQVLINLYAKVEQSETLPGVNKTISNSIYVTPTEDTSFKLIRDKLKQVSQLTEPPVNKAVPAPNIVDKEPVLFHRRPNKPSTSASTPLPVSPSKRQYTRRLVSPEPDDNNSRSSQDEPGEGSLYHRRRRRPLVRSRRKAVKSKASKHEEEEINITLNIPKKSLNSLNTDDIIERIISCPGDDVDIDQLSKLRTQIMRELKHTGVNQDISDILLRNCNKNNDLNIKKEVEEGELSDSESESIEKVYSNLVIELKNDLKEQNEQPSSEFFSSKPTVDNEEARKIKITLVSSNSDIEPKPIEKQDQEGNSEHVKSNIVVDHHEELVPSPLLNCKSSSSTCIDETKVSSDNFKTKCDITTNINTMEDKTIKPKEKNECCKNVNDNINLNENNESDSCVAKTFKVDLKTRYDIPTDLYTTKDKPMKPKEKNENYIDLSKNIEVSEKTTAALVDKTVKDEKMIELGSNAAENIKVKKGSNIVQDTSKINKANFYVPLNVNFESNKQTPPTNNIVMPMSGNSDNKDDDILQKGKPINDSDALNITNECSITKPADSENKDNIPFLSDKKEKVVSEIDILKALKNDILNESIDIPYTPTLHQPKITKVADKKTLAEVNTKKRITLEKYKAKTLSAPITPLFIYDPSSDLQEDIPKKPSIGLTEKECDRFKFYEEFDSYDLSSDDDHEKNKNVEQVSSDNSQTNEKIPVENKITDKTTIDRPEVEKEIIVKKPIEGKPVENNTVSVTNDNLVTKDLIIRENKDGIKAPNTQTIQAPKPKTSETPNPQTNQSSTTIVQVQEKQSFTTDIKDKKTDTVKSSILKDPRSSRIKDNPKFPKVGTATFKSYNISTTYENMSPNAENYKQKQSSGRSSNNIYPDILDSPRTPSHSFVQSDHPLTPIHSFGRSEYPTPIHPFGRSDCPSTPSHPFGPSDYSRSECPTTPSHYFGRDECSKTPSHYFGRGDSYPSPNTSFDRVETRTRNYTRPDYEQYRSYDHPSTPNDLFGREAAYNSYKTDEMNTRMSGRNANTYDKEQINSYSSYSRNQRYNNERGNSSRYSQEISIGRGYNNNSRRELSVPRREPSMSRRESSVGRSMNNRDDIYSRNSDDYDSRDSMRRLSLDRNVNPVKQGPYNNDLSVQSHNRSFTIDTSVNRTFQPNMHHNILDDRKNSPSSVGRLHESNKTQKVFQELKLNNDSLPVNRDHQARSTSRDEDPLSKSDSQPELNKETNRPIRANITEKSEDKCIPVNNKSEMNVISKPLSNRDPRNKSNQYVDQKRKETDKTSNNNDIRDPRLRKHTSLNCVQNNTKLSIDRRPEKDNKNYGNVYTNDNIAKGNVLDPACGVKNYKIPKIKRVEEEKIEIIEPEKLDQHGDQNKTDPHLLKSQPKVSLVNTYIEQKTKDVKSAEIDEIQNKTCKQQNAKTTEDESDKIKSITEIAALDSTEEVNKQNESFDDDQDAPISTRTRRRKALHSESESSIDADKTLDEAESGPLIEKPDDKCNTSFDSRELELFCEQTEGKEAGLIENLIANLDKDLVNSKLDIDFSDDYFDIGGSPLNNESILEESIASNSLLNESIATKTLLEETIESQTLLKESLVPTTLLEESNETKTLLEESIATKTLVEESIATKTLVEESIATKPLVKEAIATKTLLEESIATKTLLEDSNETKTPLLQESNATKTLIQKSIAPQTLSEQSTLIETQLVKLIPIKTQPAVVVISTETLNINDVLVGGNIDNSSLENTFDLPETKTVPSDTLNQNVVLNKAVTPINLSDDKSDGANKVIIDISPKLVTIDNEKTLTSSFMKQPDPDREFINEANVTETLSVNPKLTDSILEDSTVSTSNLEVSEKAPVVTQSVNPNNGDVSTDTVTTTDVISIIDNNKRTPDSYNEANIPNMTQLLDSECVKDDDILHTSTDSLPDSTNEMQTESDITSTNEKKDDTTESTSNIKSNESSLKMVTLDGLLSILQDKAKIKELLSMISDQTGESEKIKRKLEKLTEIVCDDDENPSEDDENTIKPIIEPESTLLAEDKNTQKPNDSDNNLNPIELDSKSEKSVNLTNNDLQANINELKDGNVEELVKNNPKECVEENYGKKVTKRKYNMKKRKKKVGVKKRVTRATIDGQPKTKGKRGVRELASLQEDLKEMFMNGQDMDVSGIRMCRLAKLVTENNIANKKSDGDEVSISKSEDSSLVPNNDDQSVHVVEKPLRKKAGSKPKPKACESKSANSSRLLDKKETTTVPKYKPGPKSKKAGAVQNQEDDPYAFESDNISEITKASESPYQSSDSEVETVGRPKPKRKKCAWQLGIIAKKGRKKKNPEIDMPPRAQTISNTHSDIIEKEDKDFFTDKTYCFNKNMVGYSCKLCTYNGNDIVHHYKQNHSHYEVPLSRINPKTAKHAINQSLITDFKSLQNVTTSRHVCRFCFKVFENNTSNLKCFFRHVVTMHTGEYRQQCTQCTDLTKCPITLDIPSPPKDDHGLLLAFICGECNYTQISLENLKTHVAVRHDNEQTAVYAINIGDLTQKSIKNLTLQQNSTDKMTPPRTLRSSRNTSHNTSLTSVDISGHSETSDQGSDNESLSILKSSKNALDTKTPTSQMQSKITFESDDTVDTDQESLKSLVKNEAKDHAVIASTTLAETNKITTKPKKPDKCATDKLFLEPHFQMCISDSGNKEYCCCINGQNHYKTALLISMKKHVQIKHKEVWDGYCCLCKVIVTTQGNHYFKDCFQHFLDKHMDEFPECIPKEVPLLSESPAAVTTIDVPKSPEVPTTQTLEQESPQNLKTSTTQTYINVRPLFELMPNVEECSEIRDKAVESPLPKIHSVISLNSDESSKSTDEDLPEINNVLQMNMMKNQEIVVDQEVVQQEIISQKHQIVVQAMLTPEKLVQCFKCAGNFCSFTGDSPEAAVLHITTHERLGGTGALRCAYCSYNVDNGIDLVAHVLREHGHCEYSCKLCFYRAAAVSSVESHVKRVHKDVKTQGSVLKVPTPAPSVGLIEDTLSHINAVPLYVCNQGAVRDVSCQFRHYIPGTFAEHLQLRHQNETKLNCSFCESNFPKPVQLIHHLQSHGLHLYQCSWCVHGCESKGAIIEHISVKHPGKKVNAYLRHIIQHNDGKPKVLPLVHINKKTVETVAVTASTNQDSPIKEVERAIQLESLIGATNAMIGNGSLPKSAPQIDVPPSRLLLLEPSLGIPPKTPPPIIHIHEQTTPVFKQEPDNSVGTKREDIISLESDEEDTKEGILGADKPANIVDLTEEEDIIVNEAVPDVTANLLAPVNVVVSPQAITTATGVPPKLVVTSGPPTSVAPATSEPEVILKFKLPEVFRCGNCQTHVLTTMGYKRHVEYCNGVVNGHLKCGHCTFSVSDKPAMVEHYLGTHLAASYLVCKICNFEHMDSKIMQKHMSNAHGSNKITTLKEQMIDGVAKCFVVPSVEKKSVPTKRKRLSTPTTTPTKKKYGPKDIFNLPINPILDADVYCALCEFHTKVRLNMVRHLQQHANPQLNVASTAPVNPVPLLDTNERHFDKMANLASSSMSSKADRLSKGEGQASQVDDLSSRYPQFVPDRTRLACGAQGCLYISVDEATLKCHWGALHVGSSDFKCVHCPPTQRLSANVPLTASRIIAHLKMHDAKMYACSFCNYYHHQKTLVEKHTNEKHGQGANKVLVIREPSTPVTSMPNSVPAPSMDLKPWHCGLCSFKSMLRPEVVDHCALQHQSRFQYKCGFCQWRSSGYENVIKHHSTSHSGESGDVIYYFYKEGSVSEDGGMPLWQKQQNKLKSLKEAPSKPNLNLVKCEQNEDDMSLKSLKAKFGEFCDPKSNKYVCPLCKTFVEETKDAMTCHLYEELNYRKWSCNLCSYKGFHKLRLLEHTTSEHRTIQEPTALTPNLKIETWVSTLLQHQEQIITKEKEKQESELKAAEVMVVTVDKPELPQTFGSFSKEVLLQAFGKFGASSKSKFVCPMCDFTEENQAKMRDHLELELAKIRWCCSACPTKFLSYHHAQLHCETEHYGQSARTVEASRDPNVRSAWVSAVIDTQRFTIDNAQAKVHSEPDNESYNFNLDENSLLEIQYEESISDRDQAIEDKPHTSSESDSDDERLIIDTDASSKSQTGNKRLPLPNKYKCSFCSYTAKSNALIRSHIYRHYDLKPYVCAYCSYSNYSSVLQRHIENVHPYKPVKMTKTVLPNGPPIFYELPMRGKRNDTTGRREICLLCESPILVRDMEEHMYIHVNMPRQFVKHGDFVYRCVLCSKLRKDLESLQNHHDAEHSGRDLNFVFTKLKFVKNDLYVCDYCKLKFKILRDIKAHIHDVHADKGHLSYSVERYKYNDLVVFEDDPPGLLAGLPAKRVLDTQADDAPRPKRAARKSAAKLP